MGCTGLAGEVVRVVVLPSWALLALSRHPQVHLMALRAVSGIGTVDTGLVTLQTSATGDIVAGDAGEAVGGR